MLAELFRTLGQLSVRNEFCQEIKDHGGLELILNALDSNMDNRVSVVTMSSVRRLRIMDVWSLLNALDSNMDDRESVVTISSVSRWTVFQESC